MGFPNKRVVCSDGFSMSVQGHRGGYCSPRVDNAESYTMVEVGYISHEEPLLDNWCEDPEEPTETIYGYVPSQQVALVIAKHGGMDEGEVPAGVPELRAMPKGWED